MIAEKKGKDMSLRMAAVFLLIVIFTVLSGCEKCESLNTPVDIPEKTVEVNSDNLSAVSSVESETKYPRSDSVSQLVALTFDEFLDESFKSILLRDPEWVITEGLREFISTNKPELTNISAEYLHESQDLYGEVLSLLREYDRDELTSEGQISYDVYEWYLEDLILGIEFTVYDYPITHFTTGVQNQIIQFFTDLHPVTSLQDAKDYIARLSQVEEKVKQLIEGLELCERSGIVSPKFILQWSLGGVRSIAQSSARRTPFYGGFEEKVISLEGVNDGEKQTLLEDAEQAIKESVIPAYQDLMEYMQQLISVAPTDDGVWQFQGGEEYYDYVLRHFTTTDLSAEEIHDLGLSEMESIQGEMRSVFDQLGYPTGVSLPELFDRVAEEGGIIPGNRVANTFEELVVKVENELDKAFDLRPRAELEIIAGSEGNYYIAGSLDGTRPGAFYARVGSGGEDYFGMPTLTYHEAVPGHHFQISIAQETDLPLFRNILIFSAYTEGWARYAERLAWEMGMYEDDPYGNLGRLQADAFRAARLVIDTGIHIKGWTYDQALEYLVENVGFNSGDNVSPEFEISRYIAWPGQSTAYQVGLLKILQLRKNAIDQLGDNFDIKEFHNVVLSNGSMPLEILERVVDNYIEIKKEIIALAEAALKSDLAKSFGVIAFSTYRDGESEIYTINPDGSNLTRLTVNKLRDSRPDWSPDGSQIAYSLRVKDTSNYEIFSMNADGSGVTRLTNNPASFESEPTWSPDGKKMAFTSNRQIIDGTFDSRFNVFVMNVDGSGQTLLTNIGGSNYSPDWSPEFEKIAFHSTRDGDHEIYIINPDGSSPANLTNHPASDHSPAWSPDGSRIAFVSDRDGSEEIYVMDADGSNTTRLTYRPGYDKGPSWSPDGQFIVFYGIHQRTGEVYLMRSDGTDLLRLTHHGDFDGFPAWQPYPDTAIKSISKVPDTLPADDLSQPKVTDIVADLDGLLLDEFLEESFKQIMLRDPEWVTEEGLAATFEVANDRLTDLSAAYTRETFALYREVLKKLQTYERTSLSQEQQVSRDIYEWYLSDLIAQEEFLYNDYPIVHFTIGVQYDLLQLFTDIHPFETHQDVEDYITRLSQINTKFAQLIEGLKLRAQAGFIAPKFIIQWSMWDIRDIGYSRAESTPFYETLEEKILQVSGISPNRSRELMEAARLEIENSVKPAYRSLANYLTQLAGMAPTDDGVWQFSNGVDYYDYLLKHFTTTDMSPEEVHQLGLAELDRIHNEMQLVFGRLGYPEDATLPQSISMVRSDSGSLSGLDVVRGYETLIEEASQNLDEAFDLYPMAEVRVVGGQGDYYVSPALDGSRPGTFYASVDGSEPIYEMPTLAYHETYPGHHFQIALAQEMDLPLFRNVTSFTGFVEGWGLYAEQVAWEMGWYEDDPFGDVGRLQAEAFRAARLVVDTGIHTKKWTFEHALNFMSENTGMDRGLLSFEVSRYIAWPGQATSYKIGMLKILELRQRAMDQLGSSFDLKEFHRVVLSNGSMPLDVVERVVDSYIESKLDQ